MDRIEYHIQNGLQSIIIQYIKNNIFIQGKLPLEISSYFGWFHKKTYIDYPKNDYFGKNVSIVKYPPNVIFNISMYIKRIKHIKININDSKSKVYIVIKSNSNHNYIVSYLINILNSYQDKSIYLFVENVMFCTYISYFPKIWYNGSVYLEIYKENIIYGYIKIIYVNYDFIRNKEYNKYNHVMIY